MSIHLTVLFFILIVHFLADFCLQTDDQAAMKSTDIKHLNRHVLTYSLVWLVASFSLFGRFTDAAVFALVTYSAHFLTDYITSRVGKPFWEKKDYHTGFVVVGADQVAHYIQLTLTYLWLSK
jgi:hypothetical protein